MFHFWSQQQKSHGLILNEIRATCQSKGKDITEAMAKFTVANMLVIPKHKFYDNSRDPYQDIIRITNLAIKDIMSKSGIKLQLMKAQAYFSLDFGGQEQVLEEHAKLYDLYIQPLKKQIINVIPNDTTQNSTKVLFRQIILYLVLSSGMGDPSQPDVYLEAECALASVLSHEDLLKFIKLTRYKKSLELEEMNKLLVGIRLFNNMRRLGGAGIDDMPQLLTKAALSMETILNESIGRIACKLTPLEKAFELEYEWDSKNKNYLLRSKRSPFGSNDVKLAKELLCLWQQISFYLNVIKQNIKTHLAELKNVKEALNKRLTSLIEHTKCKVAIETSVIYPQFRKVYKYWKTFQEMLILYSVYNKLLKTMMQYAKVKTIPKWILKIVNKPHESFEEETIGEVISQQLVLQDVIYPENEDDYTLEMGGFCPTYALLAEGVVLKARPQIGIVKFAGKYYGFRNVKAAYFFCKNPDLVIKQIVDMVRTKPEYIELLQLRTIINQYTYPFAAGIPFNTKVLTSSEKSVQTETHPMPSIIDPKHRSSTWELKQDACQLANILKMRTHSMQTDLSHFAYDIGTQVNLPKAVEIQTMTDNYTNTPKLQNFLYGLRGQKEDNQHTIVLTRPIDEDLNQNLN